MKYLSHCFAILLAAQFMISFVSGTFMVKKNHHKKAVLSIETSEDHSSFRFNPHVAAAAAVTTFGTSIDPPEKVCTKGEWTPSEEFVVTSDSKVIPYSVINGDLIIESLQDEDGMNILQCITMVTGTIEMVQSVLKFLYFSNLEEAGIIYIGENSNLIFAHFPKLTKVGVIHFIGNKVLSSVKISSLKSADQIMINSNNKMVSVSFPELTEAGDDSIMISSNKKMVSVSFPELNEATGDIVIVFNSKLVLVSFPELTKFTGDIKITSNKLLKSIKLKKLEFTS